MARTQRIEPIARRLALLATLVTSVTCKPAGDGPVHPPVYTPPPTRVPPVDAPVRDRALEDATRAFAQQTCAMLCQEDYEDSPCELVAEVGPWLILRTSEVIAVGTRWRWFVAETRSSGYTLLVSADVDLPPYNQDPPMVIYELCHEVTPDASPPTRSGLLGVAEVERDGRIELHLECKDSDSELGSGFEGPRYARICTSGEERCTTPHVLPD